ncbi:MAG: ABC-F family ATP-binding cassette domain-containing protein [Bacteroidota bacterium]
MLSVNNLGIRFGGETLFSGVTFIVRPKDRIGLTGKNGSGKTTLLKLMLHSMQADEGEISSPTDCTVAYLPQHIRFSDTGQTVLDEVRKAFPEAIILEKEIENMGQELAERTDYHSESYQTLTSRLADATERAGFLKTDTINALIEKTLKGLGFEPTDLNRETAEFSGGWRMRIELSKLLLSSPDVLMLDEPTNHLDIESIQWLETFLIDYPGAVVLISHDRLFLDNVTSRTLEIDKGKLYDYPASYTRYLEMRKERIALQEASRKNQEKQIEEAEQFIERFRYKATKARQVQSRIKQLEKTEMIDIDETDSGSIHFRFPPAPRAGSIVVECKKLSKSFGSHEVLKDINLTVERGEKIAFVGKNGEGKTTLSKIILEYLEPSSGDITYGHNLHIGYYAQNQDELLNEEKTVFQTLDDEARGEVRKQIRSILGSFMFSGDDTDKKVAVLSGGERSRLALARLLLEPHNLLILDEPTNHLDIPSKDVLKQALMAYDGTLIVVSHDRYFLDGLVENVYEFRNKNIRQHLGGIKAFLERRKMESMREINAASNKKKQKKNNQQVSTNKARYLEKKAKDKILRKLQKEIEQTEDKVSQTENRMEELEALMADPEQVDNKYFEEYNQLQEKQSRLMEMWEKLQEEQEQQTEE